MFRRRFFHARTNATHREASSWRHHDKFYQLRQSHTFHGGDYTGPGTQRSTSLALDNPLCLVDRRLLQKSTMENVKKTTVTKKIGTLFLSETLMWNGEYSMYSMQIRLAYIRFAARGWLVVMRIVPTPMFDVHPGPPASLNSFF